MKAISSSRVELLGVPVDILTMEQTIARAHRAMTDGPAQRHVALNVAKLVKLQRDPDLARDVTESDIVGIDGMGIVHALRLQGVAAERVAGCDLMFSLLEHCAKQGLRAYILGARQDVLDQAIAVAEARWSGLNIVGSRNGYFRPEDEAGIVSDIRESKAHCLFVAMPTPRKERFLARWASDLEVPFIMGVGGSVDVLAGHVSRAPLGWQRLGLEWLHRLIQEPRKMAWRYISTNSLFALMLAREWLSGLRRPERLDRD